MASLLFIIHLYYLLSLLLLLLLFIIYIAHYINFNETFACTLHTYIEVTNELILVHRNMELEPVHGNISIHTDTYTNI